MIYCIQNIFNSHHSLRVGNFLFSEVWVLLQESVQRIPEIGIEYEMLEG